MDLGETESCIIEGRLSDCLLRNNPNHIAVLVMAPFDARVEIVRKKRGLNKKKGAKLVKQQQEAREAFYKRYSAGKWKMTSGKDRLSTEPSSAAKAAKTSSRRLLF